MESKAGRTSSKRELGKMNRKVCKDPEEVTLGPIRMTGREIRSHLQACSFTKQKEKAHKKLQSIKLAHWLTQTKSIVALQKYAVQLIIASPGLRFWPLL
jgi:hypothetical protein